VASTSSTGQVRPGCPSRLRRCRRHSNAVSRPSAKVSRSRRPPSSRASTRGSCRVSSGGRAVACFGPTLRLLASHLPPGAGCASSLLI
jgi:hypothetical protein